MRKLEQVVTSHLNAWTDELFAVLAQPSVSADDANAAVCAELFAALMNKSGIETRVYRREGTNPIVYGEARSKKKDAGTVLFMGHYDVVPPGDLDKWVSPPFVPTIRDGKIFARGTVDNKGQSYMHVKGVQACLEAFGDLSCNVKFLLEGKEEIGSPGLMDFCNEYRDMLSSDFVMNSDGGRHISGRPTIILGCRGSYGATVEFRTANSDIHGCYASSVPSAAWRMVSFLSTLVDEKGNIILDGFYTDVAEPDAAQLDAVRQMPSANESRIRDMGLSHNKMGRVTDDVNYNDMFEPTLNIGHLESGSEAGTVPSYARVRLNMNLIPNQTPDAMRTLLRQHAHAHGFDDAIITDRSGCEPCGDPIDAPYLPVLTEALGEAFGVEPLILPWCPGAGPVKVFKDTLGHPNIMIPLVHADQCNSIHGPNENILVSDYENGILAAALMYHRFGDTLEANKF